jgi:hypothetical protein
MRKQAKHNPDTTHPSCRCVVGADEKINWKTLNVDPINHPAHYTAGGIEAIDVIEAWALGFHAGNVVKYIARCGSKPGADELEDLRKAKWYLDRLVQKIELAKSVAQSTSSTQIVTSR